MLAFGMRTLLFGVKQILRRLSLKPLDFAFDKGWVDADRYDLAYGRMFAKMYYDIEHLEQRIPKEYEARLPKSTEAMREVKDQLADAIKYLIGD